MARIPMGEFGQATVIPRPERSRVLLRGNEPIAQAAADMGAALRQAGGEFERHLAQEQEEAHALARARASNALLDDEIEQTAIVESIRTGVADGSIPYEKAREELEARLGQRKPVEVPELDPVGRENYDRGLTRNRHRTTLAVEEVVKAARRADFKAQIIGTRDRLGKFASDPAADVGQIVERGAALRELATAAGLGGTFDKEHQDFADKAYSDNARARLVAYRDDMAGLEQLVRDLTEADGYYTGKLDADKTNTILSQVQTRIAQLQARSDIDARKGEAAADRVLRKFEAQIASTIAAPVDVMAEWAEAVRLGTPEQQAEFDNLLRSEIEVRELLARSPIEQRTALEDLRAQQRVEGATVQQQANLRRLEAAVESNLRDLREQPLAAHGRLTGETVPPLDLAALASGDLSKVQGQLAARGDLLTSLREQYGDEVGKAPLLPQEAAALSAALGRIGPQKTAEFFGILRTAIDDPGMYRAAMQQIAPDSPVRAMAGIIFAEQRETTIQAGGLFRGARKAEAGDIARVMLEGEDLINKSRDDATGHGRFPAPTPAQFRLALSEISFDQVHLGTAFAGNPEAYSIAEQAVRAYYVGDAARAGDLSDEIDPERLRRAVLAVLGQPLDVNGAGVFAPWGMDEGDFLDRLESGWLAAAEAIPAGFSRDLDDYQLRQVGANTYRVIGAGGTYLHTTAGEPLTLTIGRDPQPKTARALRDPGTPDMSTWRGGARGL